MKNNQKGFGSSALLILIAIVSVIIAGGIFYYFQNTEVDKTAKNLIVSDYGFNITLPAGWRVWEGPSAMNHIQYTDGEFIDLMFRAVSIRDEGGKLTREIVKEIAGYQTIADDWVVESSSVIYMSNANVDYLNRSLAYAGEIASTLIDSEEMLDSNTVQIIVSSTPVELGKEVVDTNSKQRKYIDIKGKKVWLQVSYQDDWDLVGVTFITYPIESSDVIDGEEVQSLVFIKYIDKNNPKAVENLINFIEELKIN